FLDDITKQVDDHKADAMPEAPHEEVRACAVPQPADRHRDDSRDAKAPLRSAATRHLHEEPEPDPLRQGDMPAVPELHEVRAQVRAIEVFAHAVAEERRRADRDVGITAEVPVEAKPEEE